MFASIKIIPKPFPDFESFHLQRKGLRVKLPKGESWFVRRFYITLIDMVVSTNEMVETYSSEVLVVILVDFCSNDLLL